MKPEEGPENQSAGQPEDSEARRRRLAEVFGDVLPDQTSDDAVEPDTEPDHTEEWLRRQVPPHHGQ
jgi:hypothetical protein